MELNLSYEAIGKGFVQQYYALFDDPAQRPNLINMYNVSLNYFSIFPFVFYYLRCNGNIKFNLNTYRPRPLLWHLKVSKFKVPLKLWRNWLWVLFFSIIRNIKKLSKNMLFICVLYMYTYMYVCMLYVCIHTYMYDKKIL